ncbi:MAG: ABC transporter ATP-binding protein [Betaproteobacteria bacterium]|nr:ABC transporter ATP-binding protein [Betaproteobacteria bacterium]
MSSQPILRIEDLRTYFHSRVKQAFVRSVDGVDLEVAQGETLGVVGESGSGKSVTMLSAMGLVSAQPGIVTGRVVFDDGTPRELLEGLGRHVALERRDGRIMGVEKDERGWRAQAERNLTGVRGRRIAMIFQNPKAAMNPFETIGRQIAETVRLHTGVKTAHEARERAIHWLGEVRIDSPRLRYDNHPHGLSGGMCQRAMIAMALAAEPRLLIADEPTTGLDATIQARIVDLLAELRERLGMTMVLISHDIGVIVRLSDRVAVMYGGRVMESGPAAEVLTEGGGGHPYTQALLASIPQERNLREKGRLPAIEGEVLDTINVPRGCRFRERCQRIHDSVRARCEEHEPELAEVSPGRRVRCWLYQA